MREVLIPVVAVGFAALIFAGPKPAAAAPTSAALAYGESNVGVVEQVGRKYRYSRKYRRGPYYRGLPIGPMAIGGGPTAIGAGHTAMVTATAGPIIGVDRASTCGSASRT